MKIIVDADAQPAKEAILSAAKKHSIRTVFVMSNAHYSEKNEEADEVILVDNRKQEADIKIMNIAAKGDIAVTGDTGLGLFLAAKGLAVISPRGRLLSEDDLVVKNGIAAIEKKSLRAKKGKIKLRGPSKYTAEDRTRLEAAIEKVILNGGAPK
jgi:uncharacterized protein YaiI (UPF0178 family)